MSYLKIFPENQPDSATLETDDGTVIAKKLGALDVRFERWETQTPLPKAANDETVLKTYDADIVRLKAENGYQSVDVIRLQPDHPEKTSLRAKFLSEHTHSENEVRFFVEGSGIFYMHAQEKVYMVLCERGDLISVPAGMPHWFDMSKNPDLTCIRLFTAKEGWVADYTDSKIADNFPKFEK